MIAIASMTMKLTLRRLWSQRGLVACFLVGLIAAVAILAGIPMYSDAVNKRLLNSALQGGSTLPPFSFVWRYIGAYHGDLGYSSYQSADRYFTSKSASILGLPLETQVRHIRSPRLELWPDPAEQRYISNEPLLSTSLGVLSDFERHVQFVQGNLPSTWTKGSLPVAISLSLAESTGMQVGEGYQIRGAGLTQSIEITGIWKPLDPGNPYWFYQPGVFDEMLMTTEGAFISQVVPALPLPIAEAVWYQIYDGSSFQPSGVPGLMNNVGRIQAQMSGILPGVSLDASPLPAMQSYGGKARLFTLQLSAFAIPILGFILYFVSLIARMIVQRSEFEIAVWRSRGAYRWQILLVYLFEGGLVGAIGLLGGLFLGKQIAALMMRTEGFLVFQRSSTSYPVQITPAAWQFGLAGVVLCLLALVLPAFSSSSHTVLTFRLEGYRTGQKPFWQKFYLDFLLLIPLSYGIYLVSRQGILGGGTKISDDPLLFLIPALFCLCLSLIFMRIFPYLIRFLAWLSSRYPNIAALLTLRQLGRATARYTGPLLLLCLTLSLAIFTASMASTLDRHLVDQVYYRTGADLNLAELGEPVAAGGDASQGYSFLPVADHQAVNGVLAAARLGDYPATANIGGTQTNGRLFGIDRLDLPQAAFFRSDFAAEPMVALMNRLAVRRSGLLVSRSFLQQRKLAVGDDLMLTVAVENKFVQIPFTILGTFDLFPTYYPSEGALFIANLDYLFEKMGGEYPYHVWLKTEAGISSNQIVSDLRQRSFTIVTAQDARRAITDQQSAPERQGIFGLLSVGFFTAALLTVLGYIVYEVVGFQRRFIELAGA